MKQIITLLLIGIIAVSCSRDDEPQKKDAEESLVTKIALNVYNPSSSSNETELFFLFNYDNQKRLIKKTGGFLELSGSTGYNGFFTKNIYTSLIYNDNKVTVENFSSSNEFTVPKKTKHYILNNSKEIITKETPNDTNNYLLKKEIFEYSNSKLVEIKTSLPNMPYFPQDPNDYILTYSEKFYYDLNGNLSKTEYYEQRNGINMGEKIVRTFENYDTSSNPTKYFYLLDEYFYRSVSKNNFRKYSEQIYNNNVLTSTSESSWTFNYDSNGNIILN